MRSIGTHPVSEEYSEIGRAVRLGSRDLFRNRKTLLISTASSELRAGRFQNIPSKLRKRMV